jgi:hypothetical protein
MNIYLDDVRTPTNTEDWNVVRNYDEFVALIKLNGIDSLGIVSLDHDLGDTAMQEYFNNVSPHYVLDYGNIKEKTGLDCAKWLVDEYYDKNPERLRIPHDDKKGLPFKFPVVYVHSANPIGSANIMGYVNNFYMNEGQPQTCVRVKIEHTVNQEHNG